jgi:hypothetical protein
VIEPLFYKCEALSSNPSLTTKKKDNGGEMLMGGEDEHIIKR